MTLAAKFNGGYARQAMDPAGSRIGFSATGSLKRSEFGVSAGVPPAGSSFGVGDDVDVIIEAEFTRPAAWRDWNKDRTSSLRRRTPVMAEDLVLYTNPMSRARIARWMLEETGQSYRTELLQYGTTMKAPEYLAINPMGKVPALRHGDVVVTEGAAICAYLADVFPESNLAPPPSDRGAYYRWLFFGAGPVEAAVSNKALGFEVPPERKGMIGYGSFADVMDTLEIAVTQGEYLAGDRFTAADVYLGSQIGWGMGFGTIEKRPAFERYWDRIAERPAAVRAKELDDALMAQTQPPPRA